MNPEYQQYQKQFQVTRLLAFVMMILAPVAFIGITFVVQPAEQTPAGVEFLFYSLLGIAIVMPFSYKIVERVQIGNFRKDRQTKMSPGQLFTTLTIIKCAFVEAVFMFGLMVFFLTVDRTYMWYFYPIGAAWAAVYWPTQGNFKEFMKKVQVRDTQVSDWKE